MRKVTLYDLIIAHSTGVEKINSVSIWDYEDNGLRFTGDWQDEYQDYDDLVMSTEYRPIVEECD